MNLQLCPVIEAASLTVRLALEFLDPSPLRLSRTGYVVVPLWLNVRKGPVARLCLPPNFASPCKMGTKPSTSTSRVNLRKALKGSSGFFRILHLPICPPMLLLLQSSPDQRRNRWFESLLLRESTFTVQTGNVVSNSLQAHQLGRQCACSACEYKCKKSLDLWISPGMVHSTQNSDEEFLTCAQCHRLGAPLGRTRNPHCLPGLAASRSKLEYSRLLPSISARSSFHNSSGILRKTSTTAGSNCVPEQRKISARAASKDWALR